jgi:hypothetical protein
MALLPADELASVAVGKHRAGPLSVALSTRSAKKLPINRSPRLPQARHRPSRDRRLPSSEQTLAGLPRGQVCRRLRDAGGQSGGRNTMLKRAALLGFFAVLIMGYLPGSAEAWWGGGCYRSPCYPRYYRPYYPRYYGGCGGCGGYYRGCGGCGSFGYRGGCGGCGGFGYGGCGGCGGGWGRWGGWGGYGYGGYGGYDGYGW